MVQSVVDPDPASYATSKRLNQGKDGGLLKAAALSMPTR